jgi:nucleotide-binding universal stress UspA family protein
MLAIKTILHPTDFSERSELAFRLACSLARDYGARLVVLHVVPVPTVYYGEGVMVAPPPEDQDALREKLVQLKPRDPKVAVEHQLLKGDAATEIVRVAEETKADVIVIGSHGRTGLARLMLGSVAEKVMRNAPCPVVTVRVPLSQLEEAAQETASSSVPATR